MLSALLAGVTDEQMRWKPRAEDWSVLEVLRHLLDEEREDFGTRVFMTLASPTESWPGIDPAGWPAARRYNEADPTATLAALASAREESVKRLRALHSPDWSAAHRHPKFGPIRAGDLLASWAAHDLLHLRQITKRLFEYHALRSAPFETRYAGQW